MFDLLPRDLIEILLQYLKYIDIICLRLASAHMYRNINKKYVDPFTNIVNVLAKYNPNKNRGEIINILTTEYYFFDQTTRQWIKQGSFAHSDFTSRNSINWGTVPPTPATQGIAGSIYVYYAASDPVYFHVYVKNPDGWKLYPTPLRGPGLIPDAPANINVTGFTTVKHRNWLLYLGGALLIVGILGSVVAFASKKPTENLPSISPSSPLPSRSVRRSTNPFDEDED